LFWALPSSRAAISKTSSAWFATEFMPISTKEARAS
jgi:hypothetical protein